MQDFLEFASEETVIDLNKDDNNGVGLFRLYLMNCTQKTWDHYINDMIKEVDEQYKFSSFLDLKDIECIVGDAKTAYFAIMRYSYSEKEGTYVSSEVELIDKLKQKHISSIGICLEGNISMLGGNKIFNDLKAVCPDGNIYGGFYNDDSPDDTATVYIFAA